MHNPKCTLSRKLYLILREDKGLRADLVVEAEDVLVVEGDPPHHQAVQRHSKGPYVRNL